MRLGEIKQIVDNVVDDNSQIVIDHSSIYGGQAYLINNFKELVEVYDLVNDLEWNDADDTQLKPIIEKYRETENPVQIEQTEFSTLSTYVTAVNEKMTYYYSILEEMVDEQDEKVINIKLQPNVSSLSDLSAINARLEKTLKLFNIDGQFEFKGFDKGSLWYMVLPVGFFSWQCLIHGLDIAKRYFETREAYYKSKKAELDYRASLSDESKYDAKEYEKYMERRLKLMIEDEVSQAVKNISELNGKTKDELQTSLVKGVEALVKELGEGTEFHLSLNPPEYVSGDFGNLVIDYKKIQQIRAEEAEKLGKGKTKELPAPVEAEQVESETEVKK